MLWIREDCVNATEHYRFGDPDVYETSFEDNEKGDLYRSCVKQFGRCIGKVYVDFDNRIKGPIGWVFLKRDKYEDTGDSFLKETWVTVHTGPPEKITNYHYAEV